MGGMEESKRAGLCHGLQAAPTATSSAKRYTKNKGRKWEEEVIKGTPLGNSEACPVLPSESSFVLGALLSFFFFSLPNLLVFHSLTICMFLRFSILF